MIDDKTVDELDISSKPFDDKDDTIKGKTGGDEYLREAGSDDEAKAADFIKQYEKDHFDQQQKKISQFQEQLRADKDTLFDYELRLAETANLELDKLDWPPGWRASAFATKDNGQIYFDGKILDTQYGMVIIVRDNLYRYSYRAFTISKNTDVDYIAMRNLVSQAENMIDAYKKLLYMTNPREEGEVINPVSKAVPVKSTKVHRA